MGLDKDDIKALIAILQKGLSDDDDSSENNIEPKPKTNRIRKNTQPKKPKRPNKFENMVEFNMCKEDIEFDKKIKKPPPSIRNRQFNFVKVKCRVCGKEDKVPPTLVDSIERYKCNKCATGAG